MIICLMIQSVLSSHCDKFSCFTTSKQGAPNQIQHYEANLAYTFWFKYYLQSNGPFRITIFREQTDLAIIRGISYDVVINDQIATHEINLINYQTFWENQIQLPIEQDQGSWHFVIFSIENYYINLKIVFNGNIYRALIIHVTMMPLLIENNLYYPKTVVIICSEQWIDVETINEQFFDQIINCGDKRNQIHIKYEVDILNYSSTYFDINYQKFQVWLRDLNNRANFSLDFYSVTYNKQAFNYHYVIIFITRLFKVQDNLRFQTYDWNSDLFEEYLLQVNNIADLNQWYCISLDFQAKQLRMDTVSQKLVTNFKFFKNYPNAQIKLQIHEIVFQDLYIQDEINENCSPNCQVCSFNECKVCRGNRITTKCQCPVGMIDYGEQDCEYQFRKLDMQIKNTFDDKCPIGYQQCSDQIICDHNYIQYQNKCYKCPQLGAEICQACQIILQLLQNKLTCQYLSTANFMRFKNNNIDQFMKFQNQLELLSMETVFYDRQLSSIIIEYKFTDSFLPLDNVRQKKLFQRLECPYNYKAFQNINSKLEPICQKLPKGCLDIVFYEYEVICNLCQPNYSLINNKCMKCPQYCQSCTIEKCISCIESYFINLQGQCQLCTISRCQVCYQYMDGLFSLNNDFDYKKHYIFYCGLCEHGLEFNYQSLQCQVKTNPDCSISIYDQKSICLIDTDSNHLSTQCTTEHCKQCYLNRCILCQIGYYLDKDHCIICEFIQSKDNYVVNKNFQLNCQSFDPVYYSQFKYQLQHLYILHQNTILKPIHMPLRIINCFDDLVLYDLIYCQPQNNLVVQNKVEYLCHVSIENQQQKQFCISTNSQHQGLVIDRTTGQVKNCDNFKACDLSVNYKLIQNSTNKINYNNFTSINLNQFLQSINYETLVQNSISFINIQLLFSALNEREISAQGPIKINLYIQSDIREETVQNLNYINITKFHEIHFDRVYFNFFNIDCMILKIENYQANVDQYVIDSYQKYFQRITASLILIQNLTLTSISITKSTIFQFVSFNSLEVEILLIHNISCYNAELFQFENTSQGSFLAKFSSLHILSSNFSNCTLFNIINDDLLLNLDYIIIQNSQFIQSDFIQSIHLEVNNIFINDSVFFNSTFLQIEKSFQGGQVVINKSTFDQSIIFTSLKHSSFILKRLKASDLMISSSILIQFTGQLCHLQYTYLSKIIANSSLYVTSFFVIQGNKSVIDGLTCLQFSGTLTILTISSKDIQLSNISILDYISTYTVGSISKTCTLELTRQSFLKHIFLTDFKQLTFSNGFFSNIQSIYPIIKIQSQTNEQIILNNITFTNIQIFSSGLIEVSVRYLIITNWYLGQIWFQDVILMQQLLYSIIFLHTDDLSLTKLEMIQLKNINKGHLRWLAIQTQGAYLQTVTFSEYELVVEQFISEFQRTDYDISNYTGNKQLLYIDAQNISIINLQIYNITPTDDYLLYFTSNKQIKSIYIDQVRFMTPNYKIFRQHGLFFINQVSIIAKFINMRLIRALFQKFLIDIRVQDYLLIKNLNATYMLGGILNSELITQEGLLVIQNVTAVNPTHFVHTYKFQIYIMINVLSGNIQIQDLLIKQMNAEMMRADKIQSVTISNMVFYKIQSITSMISISSDQTSDIQMTNLKIIKSKIYIPNYRQIVGLLPSNVLSDVCYKNDVQYNRITYTSTPFILIQLNLKDPRNLQITNLTLQYNQNVSTLIKVDQLNRVQLSYLKATYNNCTQECFQFVFHKSLSEQRALQYMDMPKLQLLNSILLINSGIMFDNHTNVSLIQTEIDHQSELYQIGNSLDAILSLIDSQVLYRSPYVLRLQNLTLQNSFIINQEIDHLEKSNSTQLRLSFDNGITFYPNLNNTVLFYNRARKLVNYCNFPTGQFIGDYQRLSLKNLKYYQFIRQMIIGIESRFNLQNNTCNLTYLNKSYQFDFLNQNWSKFMIIQKPSEELINLNFNCDQIYLQFNIQILECQLGEIYLNQQCLRCDASRNEYSVKRHSVQCLSKTDQMMAVQSGLIQLKPGYWRPYFNSDSIIKCSHLDNCLGGWKVGDQSCKIGHLGASCKACDLYQVKGTEQYVSNNQECIQCTDTQSSAYLYALLVVMLQVGLLYSNDKAWDLICQNTRNNVLMNIHHQIIQKYQINQIQLTVYIITHYLQVLILINQSTQPILQFVSSIFLLYSNPNITLYQNAQCYLSNHLSQYELILSKSFFFIVFNIILFNLFTLLQYVLMYKQIKKYQKKLLFVSIYYLMTFSFSNYFEMQIQYQDRLIQLCTYQNIGGVNWLNANLGIKFQHINDYFQLTSFVVPQLVLLFFVFPTIIIVRLKNNKDRLFNKQIFDNWGYIYQYFNSNNYYQGILIIWYRVLIIFIIYITSSDTQTTYNFILSIMAFAYFQLDHHKPYSLRLYNRINLKIHAMTMIIVLILNIMTRFEQQSYQSLSTACQVLICIFIFAIIQYVFTNSIQIVKKQSMCQLQSIVLLNRITFIKKIITERILKQQNIKEKFNKLKVSIMNSSKSITIKQVTNKGKSRRSKMIQVSEETQLTIVEQIPKRPEVSEEIRSRESMQ